jgi:hypothetical protein
VNLLDFDDTWRREDRWLRFAIRLSLVLTLIAVETVVVLAMARLLWIWR